MSVNETQVQWILNNYKPTFSIYQKRNDLLEEAQQKKKIT